MDYIKFEEVIKHLSKKYKSGGYIDDDFSWLFRMSGNDLELLKSVREEILDRMQSINFRYSGTWAYYMCRNIMVQDELRNKVFGS
ncbi:MAG: hypothetical protein JST75_21250 [Bacteroidetes bacterium]|nr:hypothetical protein [Bacteroidota bacterium]